MNVNYKIECCYMQELRPNVVATAERMANKTLTIDWITSFFFSGVIIPPFYSNRLIRAQR